MTPPNIAKTRPVPFVTITLIVTNLLLFGYTLTLDIQHLARFVRQWSIFPVQLFTQFSTEFITLLTALFVQGSWVQLFGNVAAIAIFGGLAENQFRPRNIFVIAVTCGLVSNLAQLLIEPANATPILGAHGTAAGLCGATLTIKQTYLSRPRLLAIATLWIIAQQFNGLLSLEGLQFQVGGNVFFATVCGFLVGTQLARKMLQSAFIA